MEGPLSRAFQNLGLLQLRAMNRHSASLGAQRRELRLFRTDVQRVGDRRSSLGLKP
jgi:hypothetical protein